MTCGPCGGRSFLTAEEKVEMLSEYKESLEKELQGVKERIKDMGKNYYFLLFFILNYRKINSHRLKNKIQKKYVRVN